MPIHEVVQGITDIIKTNLIAKTNVSSDAIIGDTVIAVDNSFHFDSDQEIVFIDSGYNDTTSSHYDKMEYSRIKSISNTSSITLFDPLISNWTTANTSFIQKTIGHSPLYTENVFYGDREIVPSNDMAISVEPITMSNEWIYIQGGMIEDYKINIYVYGKDVNTETGSIILNKYSDAIYRLLNGEMHFDVDNDITSILYDVSLGSNQIIIEDTESNREKFISTNHLDYTIQDQLNSQGWFSIISSSIAGGEITLTLDRTVQYNFTTYERVLFIKHNRYFYDSRVDNITYGVTQKGSALLRTAELNWFGKETEKYTFPQESKKYDLPRI